MIDIEIIRRDIHYGRPSRVPSFPYPGGKHSHRKFIIRWIPFKGSTYIEPFAGRANLFFVARRCTEFSEWVLNDIRTYEYLRSLQRGIGVDHLVWPSQKMLSSEWLKKVDKCVSMIVEPYVTWGNSFYEVSKNVWPVMQETIDRVHRILFEAERLLKGVQIQDRDACDLIEDYIDDPDAFIYLDPPYLDGNVSTYDAGQVDWSRLYSLLRRSRCGWLMSEYDNQSHSAQLGDPYVRFKVWKGGKDKVWEVMYSNRQWPIKVVLSWGYDVCILPSTRQRFHDRDRLTESQVMDILPREWSVGNRRMVM